MIANLPASNKVKTSSLDGMLIGNANITCSRVSVGVGIVNNNTFSHFDTFLASFDALLLSFKGILVHMNVAVGDKVFFGKCRLAACRKLMFKRVCERVRERKYSLFKVSQILTPTKMMIS